MPYRFYDYIAIRGLDAQDELKECLQGLSSGSPGAIGSVEKPLAMQTIALPLPPPEAIPDFTGLLQTLGTAVSTMLPSAGTDLAVYVIGAVAPLMSNELALVRDVGEIVFFQALDLLKNYIVEKYIKNEKNTGAPDDDTPNGMLAVLQRISESLQGYEIRPGEEFKRNEEVPSIATSLDLANYKENALFLNGDKIIEQKSFSSETA